jgi:hypothetical protein
VGISPSCIETGFRIEWGDILGGGGVGKWGIRRGSRAQWRDLVGGVFFKCSYLYVCLRGWLLNKSRNKDALAAATTTANSNITRKKGVQVSAHHHMCVKLYTKIRLKNQDFPRYAPPYQKKKKSR